MAGNIIAAINALFGNSPKNSLVNNNGEPTLIDTRFSGGMGAIGQDYNITEEKIMDIPAISSVIDIISGMIASLPIELFQPAENETPKVLEDSRVDLINKKPNPQMTPYVFKRIIAKNLLIYGQQVIYQDNENDDPLNKTGFLYPLEQEYVTTLKYTVHGYDYYPDFEYNPQSGTVHFNADEVINVLLDTKDGIFGEGIVSKYPDTIALAMAQRDYEKSLLSNGAMPIGVLSTDSKMDKNVFERTKEQFNTLYQGTKNAGKAIILDGGLSYSQASIDPKNLEMTESKKNMISDIARMFSVPETLINSSANKYDSNDQNNLTLLQQGLKPVLVAIENAFNQFLLLESEKEEGLFFQFNTDSIFQNTLAEKVASYGALYNDGLISENEARDQFKLPNLDNAKFSDGDFLKLSIGNFMYQPNNKRVVVPNTGAVVSTDVNQATNVVPQNLTPTDNQDGSSTDYSEDKGGDVDG